MTTDATAGEATQRGLLSAEGGEALHGRRRRLLAEPDAAESKVAAPKVRLWRTVTGLIPGLFLLSAKPWQAQTVCFLSSC